MTEMYSVTVLETVSSRGSRGESSSVSPPALVSAGFHRHSAAVLSQSLVLRSHRLLLSAS